MDNLEKARRRLRWLEEKIIAQDARSKTWIIEDDGSTKPVKDFLNEISDLIAAEIERQALVRRELIKLGNQHEIKGDNPLLNDSEFFRG